MVLVEDHSSPRDYTLERYSLIIKSEIRILESDSSGHDADVRSRKNLAAFPKTLMGGKELLLWGNTCTAE
jgi:hypothetical protein